MRKKLASIYNKLYVHFGPQNWWPAESPFEVMVGALLTQNTNWKNVEKAIANLKKAGLLSAAKLSRLPHKRVASLIRSAGYYNIKARRLKCFLKFFTDRYRADCRNMAGVSTDTLRNELLCVNGIGPETADSILLYALGRPVFVVDAYTKRIFSRHRLCRHDAGYQEVQNLFSQRLKASVKLFNEYHALIVRLAKEYCLKKKPRCAKCPLRVK